MNSLSSPVMAVDPGVKGAASVLNQQGDPVFIAPFQPNMTESEAVNTVKSATVALQREGGNVCYFEKVGFIRGDGGKGAFTFGLINGLIRGALLTLGIEVRLVPPMLWQSRMQCLTGGNKNVSKTRAQELFPQIKMTHAIADCLLIARYGWQQMSL